MTLLNENTRNSNDFKKSFDLSLNNVESRKDLLTTISDGTVSRELGEAYTGDAVLLLKQAGVGKLRLPVIEGGFGYSLEDLFKFTIELGEADPSVAQILRNHFAFVEAAMRTRGHPLFEFALKAVQEGKLIGLAATETGIADAGTMKSDTTLIEDGDNYLLTGRKFYSTGNMYCDFIQVYASLEGKLVAALVPSTRAGVSFEDDWDGFGQSRTASGSTVLDNVTVFSHEIFWPEDRVLLPFSATFPQMYLTSIVVGIMRNIENDSVKVIKGRKRNFYHAVAKIPSDDPLLQETVGKISSAVYVAESAALRAGKALDEAFRSALDGEIDVHAFTQAAKFVAKTKVVVDTLALEAATSLFNVAGASATSRSASLDRHWRNLRTLSSHNPISYKARALGDNIINNEPLPSAGFF